MTRLDGLEPASQDPAAAPAPAAARKTVPHWLLEGLFIVMSVLLGFAVTRYGEDRSERALALRALNGIRVEVEQNLATLEPYLPYHTTWVKALEHADTSNATQSGLDIWFALRPPLPDDMKGFFPLLRRSAWDAAVFSGAFRLIDYELAAALSDIYRVQEIVTGNVDRAAAGAFSATATFDPGSRVPSVRLLWLSLADIQSAEAVLLERYKQDLPLIRAAAAR
jgi:hypothetical protein